MSKILTLNDIIAKAQQLRASDIHIVCGIPIRIRVDGKLHDLDSNVMTAEDCESYARELSSHYDDIAHIGEQDLAVGFPDGTRCRVNLFRQQGYVSAAIRILNNHIPAFEELGLPAHIANFTDFNQGIVLVTGETGSGKSTTLACLLTRSTTPRASTSSPWKTPSSTSTPPISALSTSVKWVRTPAPMPTV